MLITRVANSCRLGSQAKFVLESDESKSTKTFVGHLFVQRKTHVTVK